MSVTPLLAVKLPALRLVALGGLAASAVALADWLRPTPLFCGFASDCDEVTQSQFGQLGGVPLSAVGVLAFALYLGVSLSSAPWGRRTLTLMGGLAGVCGVALLLIQALLLRRFCRVCLVADACALLLAAIEFGLPALPIDLALSPRRWLWAPLGLLALAAPLTWSALEPSPPVPEEVRRHWVEGRLTVVVVTDFECRACRASHPALEEALREHDGDVHLVRLVLPLPDHPNARPAARAYWCARAQGKGEAMTEALFSAADLSPAGCRRLAGDLGLDLARYDACVADPATDAAIDEASSWVPRTGLAGLPVVWVQDQTLVGAQDVDTFRAALRRAVARPHH